MIDVLLHGGLVVDGSGSPGRRADVAIVGDRIAEIGQLGDAEARERVDCSGLVVSPGFIDIHTHYDPQVLWDPELTPSSWYGVTTVLMGNCGFSIAPTRPGDRGTCIETLENVEAMSGAALEAGIAWEFETFGEYLDAVQSRPLTLNVAAMVGHSALRMFAMGDAAFDRAADPDEISVMQSVLEESLAAGAHGFATSKSPSHVGSHGRPVPSRLATNDEIFSLADVFRGAGKGVLQTLGGPGYDIPEFRVLADRCARPVTWCSLHQGVAGGRHWELSKATAEARRDGVDLWAQMGCLPVVAQFSLEQPYIMGSLPAFAELSAGSRAERLLAYQEPDWRSRALSELTENRAGLTFSFDWSRMTIVETKKHHDLYGRSLADLATERGGSPLDVLVDLSLDEDLETRFQLVLFNSDEDEVGRLLSQDSTILGLSDAGAHASQLCDASYALHLLGHFVRERKEFPLEFGVWRLTGHPAGALDFEGRGLLEPDFVADVCVFDAATIAEGPLERVYDFPAGADRLIKRSVGISHVLVNGQFIRRNGEPTRAAPGRIIRGGGRG
jgi:N-acyl-D-amino-acid deacylase